MHRSRVRGGAGQRVARHAGRPRDRLPRPQDRAVVDAELAALPGGLAGLGDRGTEAAARRIAYRLDPTGFTARSVRAAAERRVSLRPAPDTMTFLTGLLPVAQGVAVHAALAPGSQTRLRSRGDARGRGQIMADTLVERVTGQATATAVPVEVQLVMTDTTLLERGPDPCPRSRLRPGRGTLGPSLAGRHHRRRVGTAALHPPARAGPGRDGVHPAYVHRRTAPVPDHPGPNLPHRLVRRPDSPRGPPHPAHRPRPHHRRQRTGPVRRLQPGQGSPRLARPHPR